MGNCHMTTALKFTGIQYKKTVRTNGVLNDFYQPLVT